MYCEGVKGECNPGQQEIAFRYDDAVVTCDNHTIYRTAPGIADQHGKSPTFMAKFDEREGNSCPHPHLVARHDGSFAVADSADPLGMSPMFRSFAGQIATLRELALCYAPNIKLPSDSTAGSFAPTAVALGMDNRTWLRCGWWATVTHGWRTGPGGDVNQYLAVADRQRPYGIDQGPELPGPSPATPTSVTPNGCRPRWPKPLSCSAIPRWPGRRSATRSSSTTSTTPGEIAAFNAAGHRLGECAL